MSSVKNHKHRAGDLVFDEKIKLLKTLPEQSDEGESWLASYAEGELVELHFFGEELFSNFAAMGDCEEAIRAAAKLGHPHLIKVQGFHKTEDYAAMSMESFEHVRLEDLIEGTTSLDVEACGKWVEEVCEALSYLHEKESLVHWDLTPAAIRLNKDGVIKIAPPEYWTVHGELTEEMMEKKNLYASQNKRSGADPRWLDDLQSLSLCLVHAFSGKVASEEGTFDLLAETNPNLTAFLQETLDESNKLPVSSAKEFLRSYQMAVQKDGSRAQLKRAEKAKASDLKEEVEEKVEAKEEVKEEAVTRLKVDAVPVPKKELEAEPEMELETRPQKKIKESVRPKLEPIPEKGSASKAKVVDPAVLKDEDAPDDESRSIYRAPEVNPSPEKAQSAVMRPAELKEKKAENPAKGKWLFDALPILLFGLMALLALGFFILKSCRPTNEAVVESQKNGPTRELATRAGLKETAEVAPTKVESKEDPAIIEPIKQPTAPLDEKTASAEVPAEGEGSESFREFSWSGAAVPMAWISLEDTVSELKEGEGKGFWISQTAVTEKQWEAVLGEEGGQGGKTAITWEEANHFVRQLNQQESGDGGQYKIPSRQELSLARSLSADKDSNEAIIDTGNGQVVWEWCRDEVQIKGVNGVLRGFTKIGAGGDKDSWEYNLPTHKRSDLGFRVLYFN